MSLVQRRQLLIGAAAVIAVPSVLAQERGRVRTIGGVYNWTEPTPEVRAQIPARRLMRAKFKELGWIEGQNLKFDDVWTGGRVERTSPLMEELVRKQVDVILVANTASAVAAVQTTKTIPIVMMGSSAYPVETGLIKSFAKPGGNLTGVAFFQGIEVQSKLAQFVREIVPAAKRLAWIAAPPDLIKVGGGEFSPEPYYAKIAQRLGFDLGYYECRKADDFESVFGAMDKWRAHAVIVEPAGLTYDERGRIAELAKRRGLPSFYSLPWNVQAGGLLSYGPVQSVIWVRAVEYVDRILRGARPADLPVEMPNTLELVVNMRTARTLSVTIPRTIIPDRVIE
jgi:putative ABC transport system substrate-binding protein